MASSNIPAQATIVLWGDSHLSNHRGVPAEMSSLIDQNSLRRYAPLINNSQGGKRFDENFVAQFHAFLEKPDHQGKSFLHVIMLGGNNVRRAFVGYNPAQSASNEVDSLLKGHRKILEMASEKLKTKVCLIAPIPSPYPEHEIFFERFSVQLKTLAAEFQAVFVTARPKLSIESEIQEGLVQRIFSPEFFLKSKKGGSDIHLNSAGAKILAKAILDGCNQISNKTLGLTYLSQRSRIGTPQNLRSWAKKSKL